MACTDVNKTRLQSRDEWLPSEEQLWSTSQGRTAYRFDVTNSLRSEEKMLEALGHTNLSSYIDSLMQENQGLKSQLSEAQEDIAKLRHERTHLQKILRHRNEMDEEIDRIKEEPFTKQFTTDLGRSSLCIDGEALMRKLDARAAENAELQEKLADLLADRTVLEQEVEEWKQQVVELNRLLRSSQSLEDQLVASEETVLELQKKFEEQKQQISQRERFRNDCLLENEELVLQLERNKEEIVDLKQKLEELENSYQECRMLLEEQKAANASLRQEHKPKVFRHVSTPNSPYVPQQSISSEIEESIRLRLRQRRHSETAHEKRRVLNMIHLVSLAHGGRRRGISDGYTLFYNCNRSNSVSSDLHLDSINSEVAGTDTEMSQEETDDYDIFPPSISFVPLGCPGRPGSLDLEHALGYKVHLSPLQTGQLAELWEDDDDDNESRFDDDCTSDGCQTPCSTSSCAKFSSHRSEKLLLVKPLEGSVTLFHWRRLSIPGLGNILESREGIQVKGDEPECQFEQEDHSLSDCEEDEDLTAATHHDQNSTSGITTSIYQKTRVAPDRVTAVSIGNDKECGKSSTRKSHKRSERLKHTEEREMFILLNATQVPLSTLVNQDDPHREDPLRKRTGCVIA